MRHGFVTLLFVSSLLVSGCAGTSIFGPDVIDTDAPEEFSSTQSGLRYRIRRRGRGNSPSRDSVVKVQYRGWLDSGEEFDSSYKRGKPAKFPLTGVIAGWTEGLQLVSEGGMIELEVPGHLGYGSSGFQNKIPPNATLHFTIELIEVEG